MNQPVLSSFTKPSDKVIIPRSLTRVDRPLDSGSGKVRINQTNYFAFRVVDESAGAGKV